MKRASSRLFEHALLGLVSACSETTATPVSVSSVLLTSAEPSVVTLPTSAAEPNASAGDGPGPVPARVADLHRRMFEPPAKPIPGGKVQCLITMHEGELAEDRFHAVVLFGDGSLATWTESSKGPVEPFLAKLTPDEDARAREWIAEITRAGTSTRDRFPSSTTVVGIGTRSGERVETSYFASDETPEVLDRLVQLLKHRLELTNAR